MGNKLRAPQFISILLFLFFFTAFGENANSQNAKVSINKHQVKLKEVLDEIENQTSYLFVVNRNISLDRQTSVQANNETVYSVLTNLFAGSNLSFKMEGVNIILSEKDKKDIVLQQQPQHREVKGLVVDQNNVPIIGANIVEKGTTNGVVTDIDGNFSLRIPDDATITISYIGYISQELPVANRQMFNVKLLEDMQALDELVVIGFGSQKKINLTGAISTVKMEDVMGDRPIVSAQQALQGAIPGLQITTNNGKPGQGMNMNIRGINRINFDASGEGQPLVLVDNVPMDINMISPSDIETVTVLKDAASTAIYGARAAFGVILITTKQSGKEKQIRVNYNNNFAFTTPQELIEKATPMETVHFFEDMKYKSGRYAMGGQNINSWMKYLKEYEADPSKYPLGYFIDETGQRYDLKETNHLERMMDNFGIQQSHNASVDGGSAKTAYRLSFGYINEDGILVTNKDRYTRYNLSSFVKMDATPWLSLQADVKYASSKADEPNMTSLRAWNPYRLAQLLPSYYPDGYVELGNETLPIGTPKWNIENSPLKTQRKEDIRLFGKAILKPFDGFVINTEYTFNRMNTGMEEYNKKMAYVNAEKAFQKSFTHNGNTSYRLDEIHVNYNAINIYANYDKSWKSHNASAMVGFNQEYSYQQGLWGRKLDVINPDHPSLTGSSGTQTTGDAYDEYSLRGIYYRLTYNYKGKYLFETNGRYDGSSKFPKNNRFGFFPSVSMGWRISEESFMDWSKEYLNNFKLRGSFGQLGNQAIANYAYLGTMGTTNGWLYDGNWYIARTSPALFSSAFTWEKVETIDVGFDLGFFNNRLDVVFDWYRRDTKGMLAPGQELPSVLGASAPLENSADLRTKGWELALNWRDNIGKDWRYYFGFNLYDSRSKITKFDNPTESLTSKDKNGRTIATYRVGQEIGEIWGFVTDRFYTENDFSFIDEEKGIYTLKEGVPTIFPYVRDPRPGDILFKDLDNDGKIDVSGDDTAKKPGDRKIIGNDSRRFPYSINAGLGWKGFDISVFFQGVGKRDLIVGGSSPAMFLAWPHTNVDNPDAAATVLAHHLDYWTPDNPNAYYPRLGNQSGINQGTDAFNRRSQTKYLMDGSYIKLKNITIGYTFPSDWLKKTKAINSFKVFFSGEDLWTKHHLYKGMDPEQTMSINELYPFMKKISFGINMTL